MKILKMIIMLPCKKEISFLLPYGADKFIDIENECDNFPSKSLLDNFLLYVPELNEYSGEEIRKSKIVDIDYVN